MRFVTGVILVVTALTVACSSGTPPTQNETLVALNQGTFFTGPDGNDTRVEAGTYKVIPGAEGTIRLQSTSGGGSTDVLAVETTHGAVITSPQAVRFDESAEVSRVVLLMPDSKGLEAWGSTSEVKTRGGGGTLEMRIDMLIQQRDDLLRQIDELHQMIVDLTNTHVEAQNGLETAIQEREDLQRQMDELPPDPSSEPIRRDLEERMGVLNQEIQDREELITAQQGQMDDLQTQINDHHEQIATLDRRIQSLLRRLNR